MRDLEMAAAIKDGDEKAMATFWAKYYPRIVSFARWRHVPPQDCEDVAQEVIKDAVRQIQSGRYRGDGLAAWLRRLMIGHVANHFRRAAHDSGPSHESSIPEEVSEIRRLSPEDVLWVRQGLERLSVGDQFLLRLYYLEGRTLQEVAVALGSKTSSVWDQLKGARDRLRVALREGGKMPAPKRLRDGNATRYG